MHGLRGSISRVILLTSAATSLVAPHLARADFYIHSWESFHENRREWRLGVEAGYYLTKNNFDGLGALIVPASLLQYSRLQTDAIAAYGITSKISAFARLGWARVELDQATQVATTFGLTDSTLGASIRLVEPQNGQEGFTLDLQAQGDFPLYGTTSTGTNSSGTGSSSSSSSAATVAIGDGTIDLTGGFFGSLPVSKVGNSVLSLTAGGGFTYRTSSYSAAIPCSFVAALKPRSDGFSFAVKALGLLSMGNDPRESNVVAGSTALSAQSGGSFITAAVNPSLINLRGELGYQFGRELGVTGFFGQSIWGRAAPNGFYAGAGLTAHLGGNKSGGHGASMSAADYGRSNQGFSTYSLEAHITRVNDRLSLVKIDKGSQDGVEAGQTFDIFMVKKDGNVGAAIARAHVGKTLLNESALVVDEYFKEIWIDEGFLAKRPVQ